MILLCAFRKGLPDYMWDHFAETVPMSTYLVAFAVTDFEKITSGNFTVWARKNAIAQAQYSLDIGPKLLRFFENFFDIKFPLPKIDMVALPDFSAGAMENWGLITFRLVNHDPGSKNLSYILTLQRDYLVV